MKITVYRPTLWVSVPEAIHIWYGISQYLELEMSLITDSMKFRPRTGLHGCVGAFCLRFGTIWYGASYYKILDDQILWMMHHHPCFGRMAPRGEGNRILSKISGQSNLCWCGLAHFLNRSPVHWSDSEAQYSIPVFPESWLQVGSHEDCHSRFEYRNIPLLHSSLCCCLAVRPVALDFAQYVLEFISEIFYPI